MNNHFIIHKGTVVQAPETKAHRFWTRFLLALMATGAALAAMMLAEPPTAKADMYGYLSDLQDAGYSGSVSKWQHVGYTICQFELEGVNRGAIAAGLVAAFPGSNIYTFEAYEIIGIADRQLCYSNITATV